MATPALIPPELANRLRSLRLVSRRASGDRGIGQHASRSRGAGLEFAQFRQYEPGDDPRLIDWKLHARSDRYFVREAERESPLTVWLLLDTTASMSQADPEAPHRQRLDVARTLAACVAELALRQGDRCGLISLNDSEVQVLPASHGLRQRDRLWLGLQALRATGRFPSATQLLPAREKIAANDLVVALGDGFDDAMLTLLERLAAARREVVFLQLLTVGERDFPYAGSYRFHDPETDEHLHGDAAAMRTAYLQRFDQAQRALAARLDAAGIMHACHVMDEPLDLPLQRLFGIRPGARA